MTFLDLPGVEPLPQKAVWELQREWSNRFLTKDGLRPTSEFWALLQQEPGVVTGGRAEARYAQASNAAFTLMTLAPDAGYRCEAGRLPTLHELLELDCESAYLSPVDLAWTFVVTHEHGQSIGGPFYAAAR